MTLLLLFFFLAYDFKEELGLLYSAFSVLHLYERIPLTSVIKMAFIIL